MNTTTEKQGRGQLTQKVKDKSKELLGYEVEVRELRLFPYVVYVMMNEQKIDPNKINQEERKILKKWQDAGHVEGGASGLSITRQFWDILTEMVFIAYVDID